MRSDVIFLLQNNMVTRLTGPVAEYARAKGYPMLDFSLTSDFDFETFELDPSYKNPIIYGSIGWMMGFFKHDWIRNRIHYFEDHFNTIFIDEDYGDEFLNHDGTTCVAGEDFFTKLNYSHLHIRPVHEEKAAIGAIYTPESWAEHIVQRDIRPDLLIRASPPQEITAEYRCFFIAGLPVEISLYRKDGKPFRQRVTDPRYFAIATRLFNIYTSSALMPNVVMDFAETPKGIKLIEYNPIHGSGWYECDVEHVMDRWIASLT
jgi:hypothetical protein